MRAGRKVMATYSRVYDSRHLQAEYQEPGSAPEPYARQSSIGHLYLQWQTADIDRQPVSSRSAARCCRSRSTDDQTGQPVADLEGAESAPLPLPPPLGDGPTPSRYAVMSASAKFWSSCCKKCTSEYSEWLSPRSGFLSFLESFRAYSAPQTRHGTCVDPPCMTTVKGLKVKRSKVNVSHSQGHIMYQCASKNAITRQWMVLSTWKTCMVAIIIIVGVNTCNILSRSVGQTKHK